MQKVSARFQAYSNGVPVGSPQKSKTAAHKVLMAAWIEKTIPGNGPWAIERQQGFISRVYKVGLLRQDVRKIF